MDWIKSTSCEASGCVEVAPVGTINPTVGVRNSHVPGEVVWFTIPEWAAFLEGVKAGEFDL